MSIPKSQVVLPREKPAPKEKALTRWEKFRVEKGMAPRKKRSRIIYDEITQDWVPRHGFGSAKKIADKHQWIMEDKPKHMTSKIDPYTYAKQEKDAKKNKQDLAHLKSQINTATPAQVRNSQPA